MSCADDCPITRYEVETKIIDTAEAGDCSNVDKDDAIEAHMNAAYPDEQKPCPEESCDCLELENQSPTPSVWTRQYERKVQFQVPDTECTIWYKALYKYRTRRYEANCARGPIPPNQ